MSKLRKLTAVLLSAVMVMSGMNVFAASTSGNSSSSEGAGDGAGGGNSFRVQSVLPDDKTTDVPVNTGIEITFSDKGYADIDSLFSISPDVKGKFERHGKTVVFVPEKNLNYATVYTVTLKAGVKNAALGSATEEDTVFSFETRSKDGAKDADDMRDPSWSLYFHNEYAELPTSEPPRLRLSCYYDEEKSDSKPDPQVDVYKFPDSDAAVEYLKNNGSRMWWTVCNNAKKAADVSGYDKVGSFKLNERYDSKNHIMEMPFSLSQGFYAVNVSYEGTVKQMILQMNDLPAQVVSDSDSTVFWVNDVKTGKAAAGASVSVYGGAGLGVTGGDGTLKVDKAIDTEAFYQVVSGGRVNIIVPEYISNNYYYGSDEYYEGGSDDYWHELQLDRSVFQKNDTVNYWGYVSPRKTGSKGAANVSKVTVAVSEGWYSQDVLYKDTIAVNDGSFSGNVKLPSLDAGSYVLSVYRGNNVDPEKRISSEYFSVQKYVKPTYKIELKSDKKAVFPGDSIKFTARASFYEGTPAPGLDVVYNASDAFEGRSGKTVTDASGNAVITEKIKTDGLEQGASWESMGVYAELPEKGKISTSKDITVFTNDINVDIDAQRDGKNASLKFKVNNITLDKINSSDSEYWNAGDELGDTAAGKKLDVKINRVYWERVQTGTSYNYITKKTEPEYRYDRHEEVIDSFSVTTGSDGKAEKSFKVPDREKESYYADITCVDGSGRSMSFENCLGSCYDDYFWNMYRGNYYHIDGAEESYKEGDAVKLQLKYGETTVNNGSCMFAELQNGIKSYTAGKCSYSGKFSASDAPVKYIQAYYFNGYKYFSDYGMRKELLFDYEGRRLDIQINTDKDSYEPGEKCTVTLNVKSDGKAKKTHINLAVVDEALFDIEDYNVDTLSELYSDVSDGLKSSFATHSAYISGEPEQGFGASAGGSANDALEDSKADGGSSRNESSSTADSASGQKNNGAGADRLREIFRDTAEFISMDTDANGRASYSFNMPDDITSWRFTASAISDDLYAGTENKQVSVTAPVIVNYTVADSFMKGDKPSVGVSVYGKSVTDDSTVKYEVWDESAPSKKYTASGKAFSRVNIPLWQMNDAGHHALIIKASVSGGSSDTVKHEYDVVNTNRTVERSEIFDVKAGMKFASDAKSGINRIIFADSGRARYLSDLIDLTYGSRMRLETALAGSEAASLVEKYFPDYSDYLTETGCDVSKYQRSDGGMAILPYAASDIKATAQLMTILRDQRSVNKDSLIKYLNAKTGSSDAAEKAQAIYGLAVLGEASEEQISSAAAAAGSNTEANIYSALAYAAFGNTDAASEIYEEKLEPLMEKTDPYCRLKVSDDADEIIDMTGACMDLAAAVGRNDDAEAMLAYCEKNHTDEYVMAAYEINYIASAMKNAAAESGSVTYSLYGESTTKEFGTAGCGGGFVVSVPASAMDQLSIKSVKGSIKAVVISNVEAPGASSADNYVSIKRKYYKKGSSAASNTFSQGDIVKVNVWVDYSKNALKGAYKVTDYLPAGLAYVDDSAVTGGRAYDDNAMWWCENDGNKVEFYDYCATPGKGRLYTYYARVVSPGTFTSEGATVQSAEAAKAVYGANAEKITIKQ